MNKEGKIICIKKCDNCGKDIEIRHKKRLDYKNIFCCKKCEGEFRKAQTLNNAICPICGKEFHVKPRALNGHNCCSVKCLSIWRKSNFSGKNNHQYGLKGSKNSSWKSDIKITNYGYIKIRVLDHPFRDVDDFVFEHRLVAEKYLLTDENSIEFNGKRYLRKDFVVHHKDFNKKNNNVDNLEIMERGQHSAFHRALKQASKS